jgi:hypothetical protein
MKISRNAKCPCGSGKKYKQCCGQKESPSTRWSKVAIVGVAALLALGLGHGLYAVLTAKEPTDGRVWSAEHGHWHNADGTEITAPRPSGSGGPPPPGPAPAGKVWSEEHGHWHDP